jgi:vitellogenic carboxypeptidase-like protein
MSQVMAHADTAYFMGWIDPRQRLRAMTMQLEIVQLITAGELMSLGEACSFVQ